MAKITTIENQRS